MGVRVWPRVCDSVKFGRLLLALLERQSLIGPDGPQPLRTGLNLSLELLPVQPGRCDLSHSMDCVQEASHCCCCCSCRCRCSCRVELLFVVRYQDTTKPKPQRISPEKKKEETKPRIWELDIAGIILQERKSFPSDIQKYKFLKFERNFISAISRLYLQRTIFSSR